MRAFILAGIAAAGFASWGTAPAQAVGAGYPFCIQGDEFPGLSNCTYTSYQQCQASASGRFLSCIQNPYFDPEAGSRTSRRGRPVYSERY